MPTPKEDNLWANLRNPDEIHAERITIQRDEYLVAEGMIDQYLYIVEEGAFKIFYITEYQEQIIRFGYPNSIMNSPVSFFTGAPSEFYIQALKKSVLLRIHRHDFYEYIKQNNTFLLQYTQALEGIITQLITRETDLLTVSPTERYHRVFKRSPQLFQHIPAKYIASYLRMTPETFSRIRGQK
ncbi:Crp/Fnr family transcriptional regulator [Flavobacterium sedimenticola]|uniref:Crp/Fnr family transcriptional regulator n=1 Tax=Flavobacterium sedimenticola TaxID=3043286 RepID=A0ABT6XNW4_9FLAO|nr:Crp/Fnr family transcriptional regulator [Flavobacterium sedimenticola]MDI9256782.1 Crp/Fnr family transcriptional regulator [Flavobacterium sedimenticola]